MTKFNYKKWVTENKHGKILKESMYGDDATLGLAAKALASKSDPSDIWNNYNIEQRKIIINQSDLENDPIEQESLAQLSYDELMNKLPKEDGYKMDQIILDGLTDDEMKRTSEALKEDESFGAAGTDKRTGQVIGEILQLIKSHQIDPEEVIEAIKMSDNFKNYGLPKMDPDNWGFNR